MTCDSAGDGLALNRLALARNGCGLQVYMYTLHKTQSVADKRTFDFSRQCRYTVWVKKIPPKVLWQFFQNVWQFFDQILLAYYTFLYTLEYEFLFNYLQRWRSYAILSVTIQLTSCVQNVHHRPKRTLAFSDIFPKQLRIFSPNLRAY